MAKEMTFLNLSFQVNQKKANGKAVLAASAVSAQGSQEQDRTEKVRLEALRQKSFQNQSAVASPEVKRHLQEFVLQKKRKEAAASMSNLKMVPGIGQTMNGTTRGSGSPVGSSTSPLGQASSSSSGAILRKTASESNLLKMKVKTGKRSLGGFDGTSGARVGPYHRGSGAGNPALHSVGREPSIPETKAISIVGSTAAANSGVESPLQGSPGSNHSASSIGSNPGTAPMPQLVRDLSLNSSTPSSPKQHITRSISAAKNHNHPQDPVDLTSGGIGLGRKRPSPLGGLAVGGSNSKSLPNIPSAVGRFTGKDNYINKLGRKSPPSSLTGGSGRPGGPHHSAMLVRRSKSSAILPLRKHLIEKTLLEQQNAAAAAAVSPMEDDPIYYDKREVSGVTGGIRPIEEVMEEARESSSGMEVDEDTSPTHQRTALSFAARLGHAGLSPLVISEVANPAAQEYLNSILPHYHQQHMNVGQGMGGQQGFDGGTGIGFDPVMLRHQCECEVTANHPENPTRVGVIWDHLVDLKLVDMCVRVSREATLEEIQSVHSLNHAKFYGSDLVSSRQSHHPGSGMGTQNKSKFSLLKCGGVGVDADTYWNEMHTSTSAKFAVGTVVELCTKVRESRLYCFPKEFLCQKKLLS